MKHKKAITAETHKKYTKATKRQKSKILDEFINFTGYSRSFVSWILKTKKEKVKGCICTGGKRIRFVVDKRKKKKRKRKRTAMMFF